ncbi:MAG: hypothetical protein JEY99_04700 [Spirochaetales bacterium]|nr:hypothetical protein [Spirochaetales bacterium]
MNRNRDERDTIFSRMFELKPGTQKYSEYYKAHPALEEGDHLLRSHPPGLFTERKEQSIIDALFRLIEELRPLAGHSYPEGVESPGSRKFIDKNDPQTEGNFTDSENFEDARKLAESLGAVLTGATKAKTEFFYNTRGRGKWYGRKVESVLPNIFIFAVEMDGHEINRAPAVEEAVEVVKGYYRAANIGLALKYWMNSLGYRAVCHMDGESELILPPVAQAAGLGSQGLSGLLVNGTFGMRIRLAAVTTNMPLTCTGSSKFNILKYCRTCEKCAVLCPSDAIPEFDTVDPLFGSRIDHEKCFKTWRELGTDCGVCLAACPFSQKFKQKKGDRKNANPLKAFMYRS